MCKNKVLQVLLIDNFDSFTYNIVGLLKQCNVKKITVVKNNQINFNEVNNFNKIIISPGPKIPEESGQILSVIKQFASTKSILGICLGHQAIAQAFGGKLYQIKKPLHGVQSQLQILQTHNIFNNTNNNIVGLYHSWAVQEASISKDFLITSKSENDIVMSIKHKKFNLHGVQFHPESYITNHGLQMMKNWLEN